MMRSSRSVLLSPPARWTARRCWSGCGRTVSDPLLTQNPKKAGSVGRKQWKIHRANGSKKHKSEPKQLRFSFETTYGPEGRGVESLTAYQSKVLEAQWFMFIGTQCDLWGRPDGTGHEKNKSREIPSTYFFFDPKFI